MRLGPAIQLAVLCALATLLCAPVLAQDGLVIPAGAEIALADGQLDVCCRNIVIAGELSGTTATISRVRDFNVLSGGVFNAGDSQVLHSGTINNQGAIFAGPNVFQRVRDCLDALPIPILSWPALLVLILGLALLSSKYLRRPQNVDPIP